ncbi:trichohyalin-like isoform X4 [Mizuhopecten yessoensis]|uniref:trichohyalin-like isoform X4 n=1 Tax=Mizuhopecten yessoensis TaxID=6573 RepID=UPI000B459943|nr:trichohyalin-like isoform X4 [Mizuhopecten yessoensis]
MFSPLSRGYGTWSGELYDPYKGVTDTESLPCIEPGENTHRHGVTVGLGPRASTTMSMRSGKDQPLTCTLTPRSDGKLNIPKTFTTRKGALILFSSQEDGDNGSASTSVSRSSSRQKSALSKKFSALETCSTLGTLDRLSLSVLQYGDQEEYDRENVSIADEKNKMVLNFIHSLDEREMDSRVRPGSELSSYLRDLKYRSGGRHGATYLPRSRETMELRALLQGLQDNKWPMSYSSTEGAPAVDRSNTYAEQFTRPSSRGSTRPGSPGSGTATPRSILSARKLTASLKSLNPYRQPSIVDDSELDDEQSTSTHPTISAKVTRKSPLQDDLVRSGSASPQRSWTQRLGPTSITGSIEEEQPSDGNQGWRGSSLGTYLTDNTPKAPGVTDPSHNDEGRNSYSPKELGDGHLLMEQDDTGDVSNGETASLPVDGVAQPLVPQYTGSMANGGGLMILDSVPSVPVVSPHSSRPVSRTSSRPASYKTGQLPLEEEPPIATPKSAEPPEQRVEEKQDKKIELKEQKNEQKDDHKMSDTASLSVGKTEETTPKPPEGGKKGQQRRGHLPRGKKAKKDVTKAIDISSVQPDEEEKPKEHEITVYKTVKVAAQKEETIIPDFITEESARHKEESKEALEQQMVEMSKIVDNAMSGTVLEEDEGGLTDMELALAQKQVLERMAEAKEKMGQVDNPQPPKVEKPVKGTTGKKGGKKNIEKKVVDTEKEKLKEMRRVEKEKRLEEAKTLQSKIDKQQALRKAKEKEARDRGKLTTDNVELELEMERLEREAEEIQQAEDDVRQALAESRKKQRDERDTRRKADLERKKQLAIERRDKEKKIMEKAKNKELEMLEKIEDANVRKRQREEEELKEEEEERLAQERLEEEMREAERLAEEEEDKLRELERQAEEEAMQRLIDEREEATRKKRQIEEQKRLVEEEEDRKREIIIKEERRLEEERSRRAEEEDRKLQEEKRRLAELQRIESEAREQMQKELAHRREMALSRRDRNLEARSNMTRLKHSQGITQPWVWSYFIQWPMETYNIPIGGEPDDKKKKRPKPKAKR